MLTLWIVWFIKCNETKLYNLYEWVYDSIFEWGFFQAKGNIGKISNSMSMFPFLLITTMVFTQGYQRRPFLPLSEMQKVSQQNENIRIVYIILLTLKVPRSLCFSLLCWMLMFIPIASPDRATNLGKREKVILVTKVADGCLTLNPK